VCGIGGVSTRRPFQREEAVIAHRLLESLTRRGTDAWGYFDGERVHKEPGSFTDSAKYATLVDDLTRARTNLFLCHTRLATKGDPSVNKNNHPFSLDTLTLAHNGILYRTDPFENKWTIETDSFWMLYWIDQEYKRWHAMPQAIDEGVDHVSGSYAIWTHNRDDRTTYLFRMYHRLVETYFAQDRDIVVFGSDWLSLLDALKVGGVRRHFKILQPSIHPLPPGVIWTIKDGEIERDGKFRPQKMTLTDEADFDRRYGHLYRYHVPFVTGAGATRTPNHVREGGP